MRYVFQYGAEYLVLELPECRLYWVNAAAARQLQEADREAEAPAVSAAPRGTPEPAAVTVVPSFQCTMECAYCPTRHAFDEHPPIDPDFCYAGCLLAGRNAARLGRSLRVTFHGLGEPTCHWEVFRDCVDAARQAARDAGTRADLGLCTAGQLTPSQAQFVAGAFDSVDVSWDGDAETQNRQRPRCDGRDSYGPAVRTARTVRGHGRRLRLNVTVTAATAALMPAIVRLAAAEFGTAEVCFEPMWATAVSAAAALRAPSVAGFLEGFAAALCEGHRLGLCVSHPTVSLAALADADPEPVVPLCLVPGGRVIASYHHSGTGARSVVDFVHLGYWSAGGRRVVLEAAALARAADARRPPPRCEGCACARVCHGAAAILGSFDDVSGDASSCRISTGVLRLLLQHLAGRLADVRRDRSLVA
jgi:hypothetical protein